MIDLGARRLGESEADFCERRGREAEERHARADAEIETRRRAGMLIHTSGAVGPSVQDIANGSP